MLDQSGETYRAQGNLEQAIIHLETGLRIAREIQSEQTEAECHWQLAECYLTAGDYLQAQLAATEALKYAQKTGDKSREAIAERVLGKICHQCSAPDQALNHFQNSLDKLREMNSEFELATTLYDYGLTLRDAQQPIAAYTALSEALLLYERLQLPPEQARTKAALETLATK